MNLIEIKRFKFSANLEFASEILQQKKIKHYTDFDSNSLLCTENDQDEALKIIGSLQLDENEVEIDEQAIEGYKEWNENMYNPGHFTGGKMPFFQIDNNNYLTLGFVTLISGLIALIQLVNDNSFSKTAFWISFGVIVLISGSLFYQYYKYKKIKR